MDSIKVLSAQIDLSQFCLVFASTIVLSFLSIRVLLIILIIGIALCFSYIIRNETEEDEDDPKDDTESILRGDEEKIPKF
jgi:hypothetical protein